MPLEQGSFISKGFHQIEGLTDVATECPAPEVTLPKLPSKASSPLDAVCLQLYFWSDVHSSALILQK